MSELAESFREDVEGALGSLSVDGGPSMHLIVALDPGKKTGRLEVGVELADGTCTAVTDEVPDEPAVVIDLKPAQVDQLLDGSLDLPVSYMRGDTRLEGEPGPVLDALRWFDRVLPSS
ncbi:MAG: hypothetical protein AAGA99_04570 [Actinomycetota bacterium]